MEVIERKQARMKITIGILAGFIAGVVGSIITTTTFTATSNSFDPATRLSLSRVDEHEAQQLALAKRVSVSSDSEHRVLSIDEFADLSSLMVYETNGKVVKFRLYHKVTPIGRTTPIEVIKARDADPVDWAFLIKRARIIIRAAHIQEHGRT
jgi:hypothetical protein